MITNKVNFPFSYEKVTCSKCGKIKTQKIFHLSSPDGTVKMDIKTDTIEDATYKYFKKVFNT